MIDVVKHAVMITVFVFVMMLVIEYINVLTSGKWQAGMAHHRRWQYFFAALLGATPGCLGAFAVASMYSHGILTLGAVVAAMIATSGDEFFVMLALIPQKALMIAGILFFIGAVAGILTDILFGKRYNHLSERHREFEVHTDESCQCFPKGQLIRQWKKCSSARGILTVGLAAFLIILIFGKLGPDKWNWIRITLLIISSVAIFIVVTVPDHFLEEHLWQHLAMKHIPRIFLWTLGTLIFMYILINHLHIEGSLLQGKWIVLLVACLVGLIPESGPHLVFVTLFAQGVIPLSVLLASSIVQDGHGMLPLLAESRKAFVKIKAINFIVGILIGTTLMIAGL